MFWGAPLIARELESGTYRLAWTQSVTRRPWLSVRVVLVGVAALVVAGLASWLVSWWFAPLDAVNLNRFAPSVFTARGIVAIGYAGFALGALIRRTLPAMAATLLGFMAARIAFTLSVRPRLLASSHVLVPVTLGKGVEFFSTASGVRIIPGSPPIPNAWMVSATLVDRSHRALSGGQLQALLGHVCPTVAAGQGKGDPAASCQIALSHHLQQLLTYQPPSHFWPLQALETGIFAAAALALIGVTIWRFGRRTSRRQPVGGLSQLSTETSQPPCVPAH